MGGQTHSGTCGVLNTHIASFFFVLFFRLLGRLLQERNPALAIEYAKQAAELGSVDAYPLTRQIQESCDINQHRITSDRLKIMTQVVARLDPAYANYHLMCKQAIFMNFLIGMMDFKR